MAVLSDVDILKCIRSGKIVVDPFDEQNVNASSMDLRLGNQFRYFKHSEITHIDPRQGVPEDSTELYDMPEGKAFILHPHDFVLGILLENVELPDDIAGRLDGKSSWGRLGVVVHSTAGTIDPGWKGHLTLEISNVAKTPVSMWPGSRIAKLTFEELSSPTSKPYSKDPNTKYSGSTSPGASKISQENKR